MFLSFFLFLLVFFSYQFQRRSTRNLPTTFPVCSEWKRPCSRDRGDGPPWRSQRPPAARTRTPTIKSESYSSDWCVSFLALIKTRCLVGVVSHDGIVYPRWSHPCRPRIDMGQRGFFFLIRGRRRHLNKYGRKCDN